MNTEATLLIVDDIAQNRAILARRFSREGFNIREAESGLQALQLLDEEPNVELVLLDVMMPGLNGIEVLRRIRQTRDAMQLPVIMVTAKADGSDVAEALAAGANDYVTKPVDFAVALARVKTRLELKAAHTALRDVNERLEQRVLERTADLIRANGDLKREIAERERSQAEVHYLAYHDPLTGLGNRSLFHQHLEKAMVPRGAEGLSILFIDLDGFKNINDTLGHSIGDALLKCVALRLEESLREADRVARLGGDEFAVIQMAIDQPEEAASLASRLIEVITRPYLIDGHRLVIGASIGIAVLSSDSSHCQDLIKSADLAMYRAKADGGGTYRFFDPDMDERAQTRRAMEFSLRNALIECDFEIYYQPLVDLATGRVTCLEALLRWRHPERGFVSPAEFIPLAEEIGMIVPIGEWVLRGACKEALNWPGDVKVAVNLSPAQFKYGGLVLAVKNALATTGLPAARLELEITESVLLEKTDANLATLNEIRDLGVAISMDDFGTGYSSLSNLRSFHFDKVKIDRSFVADLVEASESVAIVRAITELGRSFGMVTVAEGVETEDQVKFLQDAGCTQAQGFLLSVPRPACEIPSLIERIHESRYIVPDETSIAPRPKPALQLLRG
jgi:diguanylate cyclase (GGDEF)-like protein